MTTRIGLVGYGVGGQLFHAPYIQASDKCELVAVVARSDAAIARVRADFPDIAIFPTLTAMLDAAAVDAVVISTPPHTRRDLVVEAIDRGIPVVADKPFAPSAAAAQELSQYATDRGVILNVFHNRRRDADIVTARGVVDSGELGTLRGLDLRFDLDEAESLEAGETGGLLRDLGSHVVDQALHLLGPARTVSAHLSWTDLPEGRTDSGFAINIEHENGAYSRISASKVDHLISKEVRVYGTQGSYVSDYADVQVDAIKAGRRPADDRSSWGYEESARWGVLRTDAGTKSIPSAQGDYTSYYDDFADAVATGGPGPAPAAEGVAVLTVLDAVRDSDQQGRTVSL